MSSELKVKPVDPKEFDLFLSRLQLIAMRVRRLRVDAETEFSHKDLKNVQQRERFEFNNDENGFRVDVEIQVRLSGPRRKKLGSVLVVFSWYYKSTSPMTDEVFNLFAPLVKFQTWPHFRELVQSVSGRSNWPRIMLPLLVAHKEGNPAEGETTSKRQRDAKTQE